MSRRNKAERYTCTLFNNAIAVLSIHVAIRTWTLVHRALALAAVSTAGMLIAPIVDDRPRLVSVPARSTAVSASRIFVASLPSSRSGFSLPGPRTRGIPVGETLASVSADLFSIIHDEITRLLPTFLAVNVR